jgi:hypothetical protein
MREGLVGGEGFAVDASVIKADANRSRSTHARRRRTCDPRHATGGARISAALDEQGESGSAASSPTDPTARWTAVGGQRLRYSTNY